MAELGSVKRKVAELESKGDIDKAIAELEKAIQEFPKEGSLFNKLGDLYIRVNRQQDALDIYEKGAIVFKEETYFPNAIALCKKILRLDKERAAVYGLLGELHKELGQRVEAANYLLEFAERKMKTNDLESALNTYNTIKELTPNNAKILQTISAIYSQLGKKEQGAELLKEAQQIETKQKELKETFTAQIEVEQPPAKPIKEKVEEKTRAVGETKKEEPVVEVTKEPAKAEISLDEFVSPEVAELLKTEAKPSVEKEVSAEEKEVTAGEEEPKNLSEIDKTVELAELYLNLGSEEEAIDCFRNAADEAFKEKMYDQALTLNQRIAALRPLDLKSRQYLIEVAKIKNDIALQIHSMLELAEALNRREAKTEAQVIFKKILEIDPANTTALGMLEEVAPAKDFIDLGEVLRTELEGGKRAEGLQNINELISQFRKEVFESIGEGDYRSHYDLGVAYKGMGLYHEAIEEFEIASKDENLKLKTCEMIGACLLEREKVEDAIKVLSGGLAIANRPTKEYFGIHFLLGNCFEAQDNLTQALKSYMNAYNIDKTVPNLAKKITELRDKVTVELKKRSKAPSPQKIEPKKPPAPEKVTPKKSKVTYL